MCGIFAYVGMRPAVNVIVTGLKKLEYRGYDSIGISTINQSLHTFKCVGKVSELEEKISDEKLTGKLGIGHTRWATHGEPNELNAHPHLDKDNKIALVHNGIIENYKELRAELQKEGFVFRSQTDSEVITARRRQQPPRQAPAPARPQAAGPGLWRDCFVRRLHPHQQPRRRRRRRGEGRLQRGKEGVRRRSHRTRPED